MPECASCGANVELGEKDCPYCGAPMVTHQTLRRPGTKDTEVYTLKHETDGTTTIDFGDGEEGARLPSGVDNIRATYRAGGGAKGNLVCPKCGLDNPLDRFECEACGAQLRKPSVGRLTR